MIDTPRISNTDFFNAPTFSLDEDVEKALNTKMKKHQYEVLCQSKYLEPVFDFDLMFSPFNEANKAFYPFIHFLKSKLKKGDVILDIGNKTGWSTAMLSALFPEQKIICISEGGDGTLGHEGFAYWFDNQPSNVEILFCNLNGPLPVDTKSAALVYGTDVFHGHKTHNLLNELMRVASDDAIMLFPHIHFANSRPNGYVEQDDDLIHQIQYEMLSGKLVEKKVCFFSVDDLFCTNYDKAYGAKAQPIKHGQNGLLALTNNELNLEERLSIFNYFDCFTLDEGYLVPNPVLEIDVNNSIKIRTPQVDPIQLLEYHPLYFERIKNTLGYKLSDDERIILYWAKKCRSCSFIQKQLKMDVKTLRGAIEKLQDMDILQIMPLDPKHVRMQNYFAYHEFTGASENFNLRYLWKRTVATFPDNTYILDRNDNTFYTYKEFEEIVRYITSTLIQNNIGKGDKILLHADTNIAAIGLFWACMQLGVIFIPVNASLAEIIMEGLIEKYSPKVIFLAHDTPFREKLNDKIVLFDNGYEAEAKQLPTGSLSFSEWLKESLETEDLPEIDENDLAVILHTSGSTGVPKGVKLAHGQLFQSAINIGRNCLWTEKDNFLTTNDIDSITGFRTTCIATVAAGGTCVIPSPGDKSNITGLLKCIDETDVTCISSGPSLLNQLLTKKDVKARLEKVTCVTSAGSALTTSLKIEFFEKTAKRISNLYGLTETAGLTIGVPLNCYNLNGNFIGDPVDCIIKIVDDNNNNVKIGEIGELLLYGYTVFKGYYNDDDPNANEVQQWYVTGDLVKMNPDGSIELTGRKKDFMKNARGEIVYFSEIEDALRPLSFIKDLGLVSFFQNESERGALFVELDSSMPAPKNIVEEIKKELTVKAGLYKIPSVIKLIEKIPRNKYGKLQKPELAHYL